MNPLQFTVNWLDVGMIAIVEVIIIYLLYRYVFTGNCFGWIE